jgi:hypothetical protein
LIRADIIHSIRSIYDAEKDETLLTLAQTLLAEEKEARYQRKYEAILK